MGKAINSQDENWVFLGEEEMKEVLLALILTSQIPSNKLVMVDPEHRYPIQLAKEAVVAYLIQKTKKELIDLEKETMKKVKDKNNYKSRWLSLEEGKEGKVDLQKSIDYYSKYIKLDDLESILSKYYSTERQKKIQKREKVINKNSGSDSGSFEEISVDDLVDILASRTICSWGSCYG